MLAERNSMGEGVDAMGEDSLQERITGFWSTIATAYEAHEGNVPALNTAEYSAWVDALRELLPPTPADVLDIGTGTGFLALIGAELGHRVTGIDLSEPMLEEARREARRRKLSVRFELRDAVMPGYPTGSFDAVVARHLIWTLREPDQAFRNWRDLVRPGGVVLAIDGHWFRNEPPTEDGEASGLFDRHYTTDTRSALPLMMATDPQPAVEMLSRAGFATVESSHLTKVHALAEHPPSEDPWYVLVAHR
jgi:SAM-dependent methyltransferase